MNQFFIAYLASIPTFFLIDMLWLGLVARGFYQSQIGYLLGPVNWIVAIIFYLVFLIGLVFFAIQPALTAGVWHKALLLGALFGFFTYATYDLTNLATVKGWPLLVSVVDMAWGTLLGGAVATATYFIVKFFS